VLQRRLHRAGRLGSGPCAAFIDGVEFASTGSLWYTALRKERYCVDAEWLVLIWDVLRGKGEVLGAHLIADVILDRVFLPVKDFFT
jgi:hypothetical protein